MSTIATAKQKIPWMKTIGASPAKRVPETGELDSRHQMINGLGTATQSQIQQPNRLKTMSI